MLFKGLSKETTLLILETCPIISREIAFQMAGKSESWSKLISRPQKGTEQDSKVNRQELRKSVKLKRPKLGLLATFNYFLINKVIINYRKNLQAKKDNKKFRKENKFQTKILDLLDSM